MLTPLSKIAQRVLFLWCTTVIVFTLVYLFTGGCILKGDLVAYKKQEAVPVVDEGMREIVPPVNNTEENPADPPVSDTGERPAPTPPSDPSFFEQHGEKILGIAAILMGIGAGPEVVRGYRRFRNGHP